MSDPITPDASSPGSLADPYSTVFVPPDDEFGEQEFLTSSLLWNTAERILRFPEFSHLREARFDLLWKRKGGRSRGKPTLARITRPAGLLRFYCDETFIVWVAADHARSMAMTGEQLEATLYHELKHAGFEGDEQTGEITWALWPHDAEAFAGEVLRYGNWRSDMVLMSSAWRQRTLGAGGE